MYDLAVSTMFPQYKTIICVFDYLRLSEVVTHRTPEQRQLFVELLDAIYKNICENTAADVAPRLNSFCPWCDYRGFCPQYQKLITDPDLLIVPPGELSNEDLVLAWDAVSAAKKIIDGQQRELKAEAYERMKQSETVCGSERELYKTQSSRVNYDSRTIFEIAGKDAFITMSSVGKAAVDRFLRDNPEHAEEIGRTASFSFLAPSFRTRNIKKKR
jgi:hypothetical protein